MFVPGGPARNNHQVDVVSTIKAKALYSLLYERGGSSAQAQRGREAVQMLLDYLAAVQFAPGYNHPNEKGDIILASAMVYDWCFHLMSAQQRATSLRAPLRRCGPMETASPSGKAPVGHGSDTNCCATSCRPPSPF